MLAALIIYALVLTHLLLHLSQAPTLMLEILSTPMNMTPKYQWQTPPFLGTSFIMDISPKMSQVSHYRLAYPPFQITVFFWFLFLLMVNRFKNSETFLVSTSPSPSGQTRQVMIVLDLCHICQPYHFSSIPTVSDYLMLVLLWELQNRFIHFLPFYQLYCIFCTASHLRFLKWSVTCCVVPQLKYHLFHESSLDPPLP